MFGDEARAVADVAELRDELSEAEATSEPPCADEVVLELRNVSAPGEGAELGVEDVSLDAPGGRDPRGRRRRRERAACARRR